MNEFAVIKKVARTPRKRLFNGETAYAALEGWGKGLELFGFNKGQFSVIDLIDAVLEYTGSAEITIATWTAASADLSRVESFIKHGRVKAIRWLVDYSFETRQPKFCAQLRETFGDDCIRTTASHAKFVLIKNEDWHVVIQTSMNLNQNKRLENFWVCEDLDFYNNFDSLVSEVFALQDEGGGFGGKPSVRRAEFGLFGESRKSSFFNVKTGARML